jgi:glycosyltransferase involved in cell wall biosynthesis
MSKISHLVAISQPIKENYSQSFGVDATVIMTGSSIESSVDSSLKSSPRSLSYFGNIGCNRYVALADMGKALDDINAEYGTSYTLDIYTTEPSKAVLDCFEGVKSAVFKGFITGEAFQKAYSDADILVHAEAFDEKSIDLVKNSVSTKIADALASGKNLFAYGPDSIASMRHLADNDCAIIANDAAQLRQMLYTALTDDSVREMTIANALQTAKKYHDRQANSMALKNIFCEA